MKVVGFNGSPRKDGNTGMMIHKVFHELEKELKRSGAYSAFSQKNPWMYRVLQMF